MMYREISSWHCRQEVGSPTSAPRLSRLPPIFCDQDNLRVVGTPCQTPQLPIRFALANHKMSWEHRPRIRLSCVMQKGPGLPSDYDNFYRGAVALPRHESYFYIRLFCIYLSCLQLLSVICIRFQLVVSQEYLFISRPFPFRSSCHLPPNLLHQPNIVILSKTGRNLKLAS
jgi:hypothetical protein